MINEDNVKKILTKIKDATLSRGALFLEIEAMDSVDQHAYAVELDHDQFFRSLNHLKPPVVYVSLNPFWSEQMFYVSLRIEAEKEDTEPNDDGDVWETTIELEAKSDMRANSGHPFSETPEAKAFLSKWKAYDGQNYGLESFFVFESVIHQLSMNEPWSAAFWTELHDLAELLKQSKEDEREEEIAKDQAELEALARKLLASPLFHAPKVTKEKRQFLAEKMFPDLTEYYCGKIVAHAANIQWYEQSGSD